MANLPDNIFFASIGEINKGLRERQFSCHELTKAFCDRLETAGPSYNALALSLRKRALKQAKDVDGDLKRERFRGPLQGVPYGAKDLLAVEKQVTTWGAKPFAAQKFDESATVIKKIEKTGGILTGKLSMVELAGGGGYKYASASLFGPGLNPWNKEYWSGGSSSGSGSAVAAGLVTYALGSETWGSILCPSSFCGVTGLRPTYGLVSRHGAMALSWTMDKLGPMCRSAEDCGLVLQAISGGDNDDPGSAGKSFYYTPQYVPPMKDIRVGFAPVDFGEWAEPASRPVLQAALDAIKALGVQMFEVSLPEMPYNEVADTVISTEGSSIFEPLIQSSEINTLADKDQIAGLKAGLGVPAKDYLKAMRIRRLMMEAIRKKFAEIDILVSPSTFAPATKISDPVDAPPPHHPNPKNRGLFDLGAMGNLLGWPALSLPAGFVNGLPIGISLVSRPFTENRILAVGKMFQSQTNFHRQRPPQLS